MSDFALDRVLVFDSVGGAPIATLGAGSGLDGPTDLLFGPHGNLFVASSVTDLVLRYPADGTPVTTVGSGSGLVKNRSSSSS